MLIHEKTDMKVQVEWLKKEERKNKRKNDRKKKKNKKNLTKFLLAIAKWMRKTVKIIQEKLNRYICHDVTGNTYD